MPPPPGGPLEGRPGGFVYTPPVKSVGKHVLVVVLLWGLTPGLVEVTENVWHLAVAGHMAHAPGHGPSHAPHGDEHGCSGPFHLCSCHHSLAFDLIPALGALRLREPWREVSRAGADAVSEPSLPGLDRPPRA